MGCDTQAGQGRCHALPFCFFFSYRLGWEAAVRKSTCQWNEVKLSTWNLAPVEHQKPRIGVSVSVCVPDPSSPTQCRASPPASRRSPMPADSTSQQVQVHVSLQPDDPAAPALRLFRIGFQASARSLGFDHLTMTSRNQFN